MYFLEVKNNSKNTPQCATGTVSIQQMQLHNLNKLLLLTYELRKQPTIKLQRQGNRLGSMHWAETTNSTTRKHLQYKWYKGTLIRAKTDARRTQSQNITPCCNLFETTDNTDDYTVFEKIKKSSYTFHCACCLTYIIIFTLSH